MAYHGLGEDPPDAAILVPELTADAGPVELYDGGQLAPMTVRDLLPTTRASDRAAGGPA